MSDSERWKQWIESRQGRACADPDTLGINDPGKYLKNRLWEAFMAGADAFRPAMAGTTRSAIEDEQ